MTLTTLEFRDTAYIGADRWEFCRRHDLHRLYGKNPDSTDEDILGARGELAFSKALHVDWHRRFDPRGIDFPPLTEIRTIAPNPFGQPKGLVIRPVDPPECAYVLVLVDGRRCELLGWLAGEHAMQPKYLTDFGNGRPRCYRVPREDLQPMSAMQPWWYST